MKHITVTIDDQAAAWAERFLDGRKISLSSYLRELLEDKMRNYEAARREFLAMKPMNLTDGKPLPKREELYDRKVLR